jgi:hypothetical protein
MPDIITMPERLYFFSSSRFNLVTVNTVAAASQFVPFSRVDGPSAEFWQAELSFKPRRGEDIDDLIQFIMKLKGGKVLARIYDPYRVARDGLTQPRGAGGSGPVVNIAADAAEGAETITLKNLRPSEAVALKAVDHLGIGENLHAVLNSNGSDANGEATVTIRPVLRKGVAEDDPVNLLKPTALFRLTGGDADLSQHGLAHVYSDPVTLSFMEEPDVEP